MKKKCITIQIYIHYHFDDFYYKRKTTFKSYNKGLLDFKRSPSSTLAIVKIICKSRLVTNIFFHYCSFEQFWIIVHSNVMSAIKRQKSWKFSHCIVYSIVNCKEQKHPWCTKVTILKHRLILKSSKIITIIWQNNLQIFIRRNKANFPYFLRSKFARWCHSTPRNFGVQKRAKPDFCLLEFSAILQAHMDLKSYLQRC
jgi:hypothetical protein